MAVTWTAVPRYRGKRMIVTLRCECQFVAERPLYAWAGWICPEHPGLMQVTRVCYLKDPG